eukprot:COSAG05_NODE_1992_length_3734_cov_2.706740_6_plen_35_part_01
MLIRYTFAQRSRYQEMSGVAGAEEGGGSGGAVRGS